MKSQIGVLFFAVTLVGSGYAHNREYPYHTSDKKEIALSKVELLPEVKAYIEKNQSKKPGVLLYQGPDGTGYYWIKVGIDKSDRFDTMWNFCVDAKTFKVFYWDTMEEVADSRWALLTLNNWRHWRNVRGFDGPHSIYGNKLVVFRNQ